MKVLSIRYRAICHATEDIQKVFSALANVGIPPPHEYTATTGFHSNPIILIDGRIEKAQEVKGVIVFLEQKGVMDLIEGQVEERMDDDCFIHVRLSKQDASDGVVALSRDLDNIQISLRIASYPACKAKALESVRDYYASKRRQ